MLLYVVRHADPDYEHDSLTELGKLQAKSLAKRLSLHGIDKVFTSPLGRAKMTAEPLCEMLKITPEVLDWASEDEAFKYLSVPRKCGGRTWSFGSCRNTDYKIQKAWDYKGKWYEVPPFTECRAKEGYDAIARGSDELLRRLGYERDGDVYRVIRPNDDRVAVFCHYGVGTTWISHLLSMSPAMFWGTFLINHSSFTVIRFPNDKEGYISPMCITLSDVSHLYEAGLPVKFENWLEY